MKYIGYGNLKRKIKINYRLCKRAFSYSNKAIESNAANRNDMRWLRDNFYIIHTEYHNLLKTLSDIDKLPETDGTVRIFSFASKYVNLNAPLTAESVKSQLYDMQKQNDILSDEIYLYSVFLRIAIICKLGNACSKIMKYSEDLSDIFEYCINGLRFISSSDMNKLADEVSEIEKILRRDPCGAYPFVKAECREIYRHTLAKAARKKGIDEKTYAEMIVNQALEGKTERERHIGNYIFGKKNKFFGALYFAFVSVFAVLFGAIFAFECGYLCLLIIPAGYQLGKQLADFLGTKLLTPQPLLTMEYDKIPDNMKTLTVITALLSENNGKLFENLENFYLSNKDKNAYFGVLADLFESNSANSAGDSAAIEYAIGRINSLNLKYGGGFCMFLRERKYSTGESRYMGWERKRGAVVQLVDVLCGEECDVEFYGDENCKKNIKYVVTLDFDTLVSCSDVKRMVEYMSHPLNVPCIDYDKKTVVNGYGIMQPKIETLLDSASKTLFSETLGSGGGTQIYQNASYDSYQELFGEGIFCGKGIFDVNAFKTTVCDAFPENIVLSHDILEGSRLRTALICDMTLYDSVPSNVISYFKRTHRWIRGDVQALMFAASKVKNAEGKTVKNPINALSKYKIIDNVRRDLLPVFSVISVIVASFLPYKKALLLLSGTLSYLLLPLAVQLAQILFSNRAFLLTRRFYTRTAADIGYSLRKVFFGICDMFYSAYIAADATVRSIYRVNISHKNLLEWTTSAQAEMKKDGLIKYIYAGLPGSVAGMAIFFLSVSLIPKIIAVMWIIFPLIAYMSSLPIAAKKNVLKPSERQKVVKWAKDMWNFYARYVTSQSSYLPPDNVIMSPNVKLAMRTSPTNIGFYVSSVLCARDFGFITTETMYNCINNTVNSVEKLEKWKGHLYNWYDIRTMSVLGRPYVSTVDSGNFCTLLSAVREGILEYSDECEKIPELAKRIQMLCDDADFSALYNSERKLFYLGYDVSLNAFDKICYDLMMSEARLTSYYAVANASVPVKHWYSLSRTVFAHGSHMGLASWTGTAFEYFMPSVLLPTYDNSLTDEALRHCIVMQKTKTAHGIWGSSESGYYAFDSDMNYQYKAFGVGKLALKCDMDKETVISPYSSFLCADTDFKSSYKNLLKAESIGLYGKYGFYEAADFTKKRVGDGIGIVESYMAHHMGMSICACDNIIYSGRMKKRFMRNPKMRSAKLLLCEKIPTGEPAYKNKYKNTSKHNNTEIYKDTVIKVEPGTERKTALVGNNRIYIIADSNGKIGIYECDTAINICRFEENFTPHTLRVIYRESGVMKEFLFSDASFEYSNSYIRYETDKAILTATVSADKPTAVFELKTQADCDVAVLYFEPLAEKPKSHDAHPAFSELLVESSFDDKKDVLVFSRKGRGEYGITEYTAVCTDNMLNFCAQKDSILSPAYTEKDILCAAGMKLPCNTGNCIKPVCLLRSHTSNGVSVFCIAYSDEKDEAVKYAADTLKKVSAYGIYSEIEKTAVLNYNTSLIAGIRQSDMRLYSRLLNAITRAEPHKTSCERERLWKFGISGDNPIIFCDFKEDENKIRLLLRIHRLLLIKRKTCELVIRYNETDRYMQTYRAKLREIAEECGSSHLIGIKGGIFFVDKTELSFEENECLENCNNVNVDIPEIPYTEENIKILKKGMHREIENKPVYSVFGGCFTEDGFIVDKKYKHEPWCNVIASKCFGTVVTQDSIGYSYVYNSQLGIFTKKDKDLLREEHGERIYLYDADDSYDLAACADKVFYSAGKATFYGKVGTAEYSLTVSIGKNEFVKKVSIKIEGAGPFSKVVYKVSAEDTTVFGDVRKSVREPFCEYSIKGGFLDGMTVGIMLPQAEYIIERDSICAVVNIPNGNIETNAFLCVYRNEIHRNHLVQLCECGNFEEYRADFVPQKQICTGHIGIDMMYNIWLPYQIIVSRIFARCGYSQAGGAYGFRDQLQDAANVADIAPDLLRCHILRCCAQQFVKGDVLHWWHYTPKKGRFGIRTRCSDDKLWIVYAVSEYIRATGDEKILDVVIPYSEGAELDANEDEKCIYVKKSLVKESVYMHCVRAISASTNTGEHGISLVGSCDWNDSFSSLGEGAESVWTSQFLILLIRRFLPFCRKYGDTEISNKFGRFSEKLKSALKEYACENSQYIRAFYPDGTPLGSQKNEECKIDLLVQAFAILSELESGENAKRILNSALSLYDEKNGIFKLLYPPFAHTGEKYTGYVRDYPKGIRENGGQYTHAAMWALLALCKSGRIEEAEKILLSLCPAEFCANEDRAKRYRCEPYVVAGDVCADDNIGRGGWSWYTGSAGWMYTAIKRIFCKKGIDTAKEYDIIQIGN